MKCFQLFLIKTKNHPKAPLCCMMETSYLEEFKQFSKNPRNQFQKFQNILKILK